jgi:DtxR family transcriptional regulator, Mn-dependent transcriptional regulator
MAAELTHALEDYLETIFQLVADHGFARVRDIAKARDVRAASVSPALKRLAHMGLVNYARREYVTLTADGESVARRVYARHRLLTRFFHRFLQMPRAAAEAEACAMEHNLSPEGMDRLARFFEFLGSCPDGARAFRDRFHTCSLIHEGVDTCKLPCAARDEVRAMTPEAVLSVYDLKPGEHGRVSQVATGGAVRQRLLDMGLLPDTKLEMVRVAPAGEPVWIELDGSQLALRRKEAEAVLLA